MKCPSCKESETKVLDSRQTSGSDSIRRRRVCPACQTRFTTRETIEVHYPRVVKRNGQRIQFQEEKIRRGLLRACEKRNIEASQLEQTIDLIKDQVLALAKRDEISSATLGELVLCQLKELDEVAYIRFASVYKSFSDIESFQRLISDLKQVKIKETYYAE